MRALRHRPFALYTVGNGISLTGTWMQRLALGWLIWELTGSGFWLGVLSAVDLLPVALIGPFAGAIADRANRLRITRLSQIVSLGIAVAFGAAMLLGLLTVPVLIALAGLQGATVALNQPARLALVHSLVPREDLGSAVGLSSVNVNLARITGPAIGGAMLVHFPVATVFFANAGLTLLFVMILSRLRIDEAPRPASHGRMLSEIGEGLRYMLSRSDIRVLLLYMCTGGAVLRSMLELAPALADRSFDSGAVGLAFLTSAMAVGAVAAGLFPSERSGAASEVRRTIRDWASGAVAVCALGLGASAWVAVPAIALVGFFVTRALIGTQTYVQLTTQDEMRGRALSLHGIVARGSPAIGALLIGAVSDLVGLTLPVFIGAAAFLFAAIVTRRRQRQRSGAG